MFKRPEEIIVLVLALLFVALTYFVAAFLGADAYTVLLITGLTLVWAAVCFYLWQRNLSGRVWPLFAAALVACWWPMLDWWAGSEGAWYAGWTVKILLAAAPAALLYAWKYKRAQKAALRA